MKIEDRVDLYRAFIKQMLERGYSPTYIGEQLAELVWAMDTEEGS